MPALSRQAAIDLVAGMLRELLPSDWHRHVKLEPAAMSTRDFDVEATDLQWLIRRPEDAGNDLRYYQLRLVGRFGNLFLLIYGNKDIGPGPMYEKAIVFDQGRARRVLELIVSEPMTFPPNHYGFT